MLHSSGGSTHSANNNIGKGIEETKVGVTMIPYSGIFSKQNFSQEWQS